MIRVRVVAGCGLLIATSACAASTETAAPAASAKLLYNQNCARCHGFQMVNPAPGVFDLRTFPLEDKARFIASVTEGKGAMPSWKASLSASDIETLWSYLATMSR